MPDAWASRDGHEVPVTDITHWQCPHCAMEIALLNVSDHIRRHGDTCMWCMAEAMLVAGLMQAQGALRHRVRT